MKTIKIFLASSEELDYDRMAFGNLVRRLDEMYEKRGIRIKLFEWEDYDSAYNDKRKQDEYNDYVRQSDIFLALFHKKAGQFTVEEFDIASQEFKEHASPKVYTYCKDLKPGEEETPELKEFKKRLFEEMGHYWCRYDNRESLQFQFVMQLQLVENNHMNNVKVENGIVTINGLPVAKMENLKFAAANEDFLRMQTDIQELRKEIEKMQIELEEKQKALNTIEETPNNKNLYKYIKNDVDNLIDNLQPKLNKYNKLKEDFAEHQKILLNTAKRVSLFQGEYIDKSIKDAIDAFNEGRVKEANYILERSEDSKPSLEDYKLSKEITEQKRQNQISYINKLTLWASTIMADASIPIEERVRQADGKYKEAIERAIAVDYDEEKLAELYYCYGRFSGEYAHYKDAIDLFQKTLDILKKKQDLHYPMIGDCYNEMGVIYNDLCDSNSALEYHQKALTIIEERFGNEPAIISGSYNNIGHCHAKQGNFHLALDYFQKALAIREIVYGIESPETACSYNNISACYHELLDYDNAIKYSQKALTIREKLLDPYDIDTATSYLNVGNLLSDLGNQPKALDYSKKALDLYIKHWGYKHPETFKPFLNIGLIYNRMGNKILALDFYNKAKKIGECCFGPDHIEMAQLYNNIGGLYTETNENNLAFEYLQKALSIRKEILGIENLNTAMSFFNLGCVYYYLGDIDKSMEFNQTALSIRIKLLGNDHFLTAVSYNNIGAIFQTKGEFNRAVENYKKTFAIQEKILGPNHFETCYSCKNIAWGLHLSGRGEDALPWAEKAVSAFPNSINFVYTLATVYQDLKMNKEALKQFELCLKLFKEQENSEGIQETETKIAELKELMKSNS